MRPKSHSTILKQRPLGHQDYEQKFDMHKLIAKAKKDDSRASASSSSDDSSSNSSSSSSKSSGSNSSKNSSEDSDVSYGGIDGEQQQTESNMMLSNPNKVAASDIKQPNALKDRTSINIEATASPRIDTNSEPDSTPLGIVRQFTVKRQSAALNAKGDDTQNGDEEAGATTRRSMKSQQTIAADQEDGRSPAMRSLTEKLYNNSEQYKNSITAKVANLPILLTNIDRHAL